MNLDLNARHVAIEAGLWEVILSLTLTAKDESDKTLYLAEVQQAGIFVIDGLDEAAKDHMLASFCPNILFPYARENIDSLIIKGSFPPLMLAPVNFDALYEQAKLARETRGRISSIKTVEILLSKRFEQNDGRRIREIDRTAARAHWDGNGA